jgi:hypothetical protein
MAQLNLRNFIPQSRKRILTALGALGLSVIGAGQSTAVAQGEAAAADTDVPVVPEAANVPPGQLEGLVDSYIQGMRGTLAELRRLYAQAKEEKDVVKTLCLNDKVEQVVTAVDTAEDRKASLKEAVENGATERARHEFTLVGVLTQRTATLANEANECIGEESTVTEDDQSILDLPVVSGLPNVDADKVELPPPVVIVPGVKSPVD